MLTFEQKVELVKIASQIKQAEEEGMSGLEMAGLGTAGAAGGYGASVLVRSALRNKALVERAEQIARVTGEPLDAVVEKVLAGAGRRYRNLGLANPSMRAIVGEDWRSAMNFGSSALDKLMHPIDTSMAAGSAIADGARSAAGKVLGAAETGISKAKGAFEAMKKLRPRL